MASRNVIVILDSNSKVDTVSISTSAMKENVVEFSELSGINRNQLEFSVKIDPAVRKGMPGAFHE